MSRKSNVIRMVVVGLGLTGLVGCGSLAGEQAGGNGLPGGKGDNGETALVSDRLEKFGSAAELDQYLAGLKQQAETNPNLGGGPLGGPLMSAAEASNKSETPSITNNQEEGVDEGDIVKAHGDHLVVLRRGRLFSVKVLGQNVTPLSYVDARPAGSSHHAWYDEMLIHGDTIVVVGFSYSVGATEIGLFDIDAAGTITHRDTHFLRSNDYYSSRNYASRLVNGKLVFYMPYGLLRYGYGVGGYETTLPALRPYQQEDGWQQIIDKTTIYKPVQKTAFPALHTIVTCDLNQPTFGCEAQGIVGPFSRNFYVSKDAVYLWVSQGGSHGFWGGDSSEQDTSSVVYRLPLDGSSPGAVIADGAPTDQFSFKAADGYLNVLVRSHGGGDWMWYPEVGAGDVALVRIPEGSFESMVRPVAAAQATKLQNPGQGYVFTNRFVGSHVLYGTGNGWWNASSDSTLYAHNYKAGGSKVTPVALGHSVDRIEVMGKRAVVVGSKRVEVNPPAGVEPDPYGNNTTRTDLVLTAIHLYGAMAFKGASHTEENAIQGETRSHGFFYQSSSKMLGLPIRTSGPRWGSLFSGSAKVLFLEAGYGSFSKLGELEANAAGATDDQCQVSCVDWYGNARPIFYQGRIFALLGYELVEGTLGWSGWTQKLSESSRTDFSSVLQ